MSARETTPAIHEFVRLAAAHTLVPLLRTVAADLETPVGAFLRVAADEPEAFLLESVEGGEKIGRYTFIGVRPYRTLTSSNGTIVVTEAGKSRSYTADVFVELKRALGEHTPAKLPGLPPFTAGAVGFFAYDVVRRIERLPELAADELHVPDAHLMFFDQVLAFDHVKKAIQLIVTAGARVPLTGENAAAAFDDAEARLDELEALLERALPKPRKLQIEEPLVISPRTEAKDFLAAVDKTKEYIAAGDVFQCVLSQRFDCLPGVDAFEIYRSLRIVNPSPYMYFLRFGLPEQGAQDVGHRAQGTEGKGGAGQDTQGKGDSDVNGSEFAACWPPVPCALNPVPFEASRRCHIVGSSPELLVRVKDGRVEYRPIAGTRPRGSDETEDLAQETSLRGDAKEVAEHIMLVDLGRNDLGRVSEFGSVGVKELMFIERYSHVMHLVSSLEGKLKAGLAPLDAFRSCFPAGTLSGAPKIRAMEIIEELEPARRGVYGGAIVYADFSGNFDSCIAIRTLFMDGEKGYIQAGAGVVADSVPQKEFEECGNKARAVVRAIERARQRG